MFCEHIMIVNKFMKKMFYSLPVHKYEYKYDILLKTSKKFGKT